MSFLSSYSLVLDFFHNHSFYGDLVQTRFSNSLDETEAKICLKSACLYQVDS